MDDKSFNDSGNIPGSTSPAPVPAPSPSPSPGDNGDGAKMVTRTRSRRFHAKAHKGDKKVALDLESGEAAKARMSHTPTSAATPSSSSSSRFGFFASDKYRTLTPIRRHKTTKDIEGPRNMAFLGKDSAQCSSPSLGLGPGSDNSSGPSLQPAFSGDDDQVALPAFSPRTSSRLQRPEDTIFRNSIGFNSDVSISQYWSKAIGADTSSSYHAKRLSGRKGSHSLKYHQNNKQYEREHA